MAFLFCFVIIAITFSILSSKGREWYWYLIAFILPLIGLIIALCLKSKTPKGE